VTLASAIGRILRSGQTIGYAIAVGFLFGGMLSYVASAQQVFVDVYHLGSRFPLVFGAVAGVLALASFFNAQLVQRFGMRRVSHTALVVYCASALALAGWSFFEPPLLALCLLIAITLFMFGLSLPNFNAIAMQPLGAIAGAASSVLGFYTTAVGALIGWLVGQSFDGTVRPLCIGFAAMGLLSLVTVAVTEGSRSLFRRE
jgi:DHA1 family bicyclomycin/chloramphenicol resistance-like MFS transporter